jgi:penicillin-binding protein 2
MAEDFEKYRVRESWGTIETHEVLLDSLAHRNEQEGGFSEKRLEVKIRERLIYSIFGVFCVIALVLFSRTFYFQVVHGKQLYNLSQSNRGKISLIRPERGIIYDRNMQKLVSNAPAYDLICQSTNTATSGQLDQEINVITSIFNKDKAEVENNFATVEDTQVLAADNIGQQQLLVLEANMAKLPDCKIERNTARSYALGSIFSFILGHTGRINKGELADAENYTSSDNIGKDGLEKSYESDLRGIPGRTEIIQTATGVKRGDKVIAQPLSGDNLVLNIDEGLQKTLYNSLGQRLKDIGAKAGAAVAMDPNTGAVLALVSYPSYDDNMFSKSISQNDFTALINDPNQPLFNRAIAAHYPTGSIIKPLEASAALQESLISPDKQINDPGYILVPSQYDPSVTFRFGGVTPHGLVDMRKAIAVSSNIYFYTVGGGYGTQRGLGPSRINKYLSLFGWNQKTGIDLPGEFQGFIPTPEWKKSTKGTNWFDGDTYNLSIGQSDLQTTPLQVASAYAAIANGGTLYKPQVVNKVISSDGKSVVQEFTPQATRSNFIDPQYLEIVREGMRDGVSKPYGLSGVLNNLPVQVAAKTGTAQIGYADKFNLWSAAFAPYDHPEIVVVVTAEKVHALGAVTLPVAHDALEYFFQKKSGGSNQETPVSAEPATMSQP